MPFRSKIEQSLDCEINVASADTSEIRVYMLFYLWLFMDTGLAVINIIRLYDLDVSA